MRKRMLCSLLLVGAMLLSIGGCGAKESDGTVSDTEVVLETEKDIMTSSFVGESVEMGDTEAVVDEPEDYAGEAKMESEYPFGNRTITINGVDYQLGCRPSEFLDGAWEIAEGQVDENGEILVYPNNYRSVKLVGAMSGQTVILSFDSKDDVHHNFLDMPVLGIEVPEGSTCEVSCGGVSTGMTESEMMSILDEPASGFRGKWCNCAWYTTHDTELKLEIELPCSNEGEEPKVEGMRLIDWSSNYMYPLASISKRED